MIKKKEDEAPKGAPAWMTTFSDLMTLILVFFILLFSFSEIDANKFRMIADSFRGVFDNEVSMIPYEEQPSSPIENLKDPVDFKVENDKKKEDETLDELLMKIKEYLREHELEGVILASREERGVELVLQENVLFDSGRANIKHAAEPFLKEVAGLIKSLPNMIEVEGHTDSQRIIQPSPYKTNWNLSGDRAANVSNYFVERHAFPSNRFKIAGYADTQSVASNSTEEGRLRNRRVVIVILDNELDEEH